MQVYDGMIETFLMKNDLQMCLSEARTNYNNLFPQVKTWGCLQICLSEAARQQVCLWVPAVRHGHSNSHLFHIPHSTLNTKL